MRLLIGAAADFAAVFDEGTCLTVARREAWQESALGVSKGRSVVYANVDIMQLEGVTRENKYF